MSSIGKNTKSSNNKEIEGKTNLNNYFKLNEAHEEHLEANINASGSTCAKSGNLSKSRTNSTTDDNDMEKIVSSYEKYIKDNNPKNYQQYMRELASGLFLSKPNIKKLVNELEKTKKYDGANFNLFISFYNQISILIKENYDQDKKSSIYSRNLIPSIKDILEMFLNYLIKIFPNLKKHTNNYNYSNLNFKKSNEESKIGEEENLKKEILLQENKVNEFRKQLRIFLIFMEENFSHISPKNVYDNLKEIKNLSNLKQTNVNEWLKKPISEIKMLKMLNEFFSFIKIE
jgi:hypothetical protein